MIFKFCGSQADTLQVTGTSEAKLPLPLRHDILQARADPDEIKGRSEVLYLIGQLWLGMRGGKAQRTSTAHFRL